MRVLSVKQLPVKLSLEVELENDAAVREFLAYVKKFGQPTAVLVDPASGDQRVVPMTPAYTKDFKDSRDFVRTFCDVEEGATAPELIEIARSLGYLIPMGTISGSLSTLARLGELVVAGKRYTTKEGRRGGRAAAVYKTVKKEAAT